MKSGSSSIDCGSSVKGPACSSTRSARLPPEGEDPSVGSGEEGGGDASVGSGEEGGGEVVVTPPPPPCSPPPPASRKNSSAPTTTSTIKPRIAATAHPPTNRPVRDLPPPPPPGMGGTGGGGWAGLCCWAPVGGGVGWMGGMPSGGVPSCGGCSWVTLASSAEMGWPQLGRVVAPREPRPRSWSMACSCYASAAPGPEGRAEEELSGWCFIASTEARKCCTSAATCARCSGSDSLDSRRLASASCT